MQAFNLHRVGRLAEAETVYNQILSLDPDQVESRHLLGFLLHQRGDSAQALRHIDRALQTYPDDAVALNYRGMALHALKRFDEAQASYQRAITVRPDFLEALINRGSTLKELQRFDEALTSFDRAIAVQPDHADAHYYRANTLHALKQFDEALAGYDRALALRPRFAEALDNRGVTLHELKRYDEALASFDAAAALRPAGDAAFASRGRTLQALKRFDEALASFDRALVLRPDNAEALDGRGPTLHALERFDEALANYDRVLAVRPDNAEAHSNRGVTLFELTRFAEALESCDRAITLRPDFSEAYLNRGSALNALGRLDEALASYDRALALRPDYAEAHTSRGGTLQALWRFDDALQSHERALALRPDFAEAHFNEALCRLLIGDFARGFAKHEWRWDIEKLKFAKSRFAQPLWTGSQDIAGKTVLLHADQGFGDAIQFCRYVPRVAALRARVILEVQEPLHDLMGTLAGAAQVVANGEALPDFDWHCPLLSLPFAFGTTLATVPAEAPYLYASASAIEQWDGRLPPRTRPRIGLAWAGNPAHSNDRNRSITLGAFLSLLDGAEATYVSLQRDIRAADAAVLQERRDILHFSEELRTFAETAALISNLDLVVTVDTSVAHLAGALAKPVWIVLPFTPDWRWLLDRDDSPWYPTARLFRQDGSRQWDGVLRRVHDALRAHFS
jgi:tetratricopeptide (TPR) repeat protein